MDIKVLRNRVKHLTNFRKQQLKTPIQNRIDDPARILNVIKRLKSWIAEIEYKLFMDLENAISEKMHSYPSYNSFYDPITKSVDEVSVVISDSKGNIISKDGFQKIEMNEQNISAIKSFSEKFSNELERVALAHAANTNQ